MADAWACPLCGGSTAGKTDEHVTPRWMYESLFAHDVTFAVEGVQQRRKYMVVKVCRTCNGWMNDEFEQPARPLLTGMYNGHPVDLSTDDQILLSRYAVKHILLASLWAEGQPERNRFSIPFLREADYRRFRANMQPSPGSRIWLGQILDSQPNREAAVAAVLPELATDPRLHPMRRYVMEAGSFIAPISFGKLLMVWACRPGPPRRVRRGPAERFLDRCEQHGVLVPIWKPRNTAVVWPPALPLDVTTHERWGNQVTYVG